jgi:hypothetical protein
VPSLFEKHHALLPCTLGGGGGVKHDARRIDRNLHSVLFHCMQQADTPFLDDPESAIRFSFATQLAAIIKNAMNPTCASNVISLLCHSLFKECVRVQDDESSCGELWLPSLLCRKACNKQWEIWTQCLTDLESDPAAKSNFNTQMLSLVRHMMSMVCTHFQK